MGTVAARLGWAFDRLLIYGKGGAAWTNDSWQMLLLMTDKPLLFSTNELRWGWMAGVGVEYAFTDSWSAKIEYNHMDLERIRCASRTRRRETSTSMPISGSASTS